MGKTLFIVNPNSSNGTTRKVWPEIEAAAKAQIGTFDVWWTERIGHGIELARRGAEQGYDFLVCVGGDGTNNEMVNGLMNADGTPVNPALVYASICMGTGGDFRKTTLIPKDFREAVSWLPGEKTANIDLGRMEMTDHHDRTVVRYFANITSLGIGGEVDERVNNTSKALGGFVSFAWSSLTTMVSYKNKRVRLILDDEHDLGERKIFAVAVANGQFFGGGMHIAPQADMADGLFDVIVIGDLTKLETLRQMPGIYQAAHLKYEKVEQYRAKKVVALSDERVLLDVDGEQPGKLPATFTICPGALKLKIKD